MNVVSSLKSLTAYPVPMPSLVNIADEAGLMPEGEMTPELRKSREYRMAKAFVYIFVAGAPDVSQGGITFSLSAEERAMLRKRGESILDNLGIDPENGEAVFGYKGEDL